MGYKDERRERMKEKIIYNIRQFTKVNGYPPSIDELGQLVGLSSKATVSWYLGMLKADGVVDWEPGKPRTLRIKESI